MTTAPGSTSYFSEPAEFLDPDLFGGGETLRDDVRVDIVHRLSAFFHAHGFHGVEAWLEIWLAGSGVSYQWAAHRDPGDLDCLLGIHFETFREANPNFAGLSNKEIAQYVNDLLWRDLVPTTANYMGKWELTFYVNPDSTDIRSINPYAAYDVKHGAWTVKPDRSLTPHKNTAWDKEAEQDNAKAQEIVARYSKYLAAVQNAQNPAHRANQEQYLHLTLAQANALYEEIHHGRRESFARTGGGYLDRGNYRWQSGKALGTVPVLKELSEYYKKLLTDDDYATYGIELPDTDTLIFRSALWEQ